jgi:parvulin-like peptidyl-prolyl isomerase
MTINLELNNDNILEQIKISCKIPEIIEQIITRRIITYEAEKNDVKVEIHELQKAADDFRAEKHLTSVKKTQMWLDANKLSLDEFEEIIRLDLLSTKLKKFVTASKIEDYFHSHQSDFDSVAMYEIVVEDKELAIEMYYAIKEGEIEFKDAANKYINDLDLKRRGGYLGVLSRNDINIALASVFSTVNTPRIIKPISTSRGFHLIWVEEIIKSELTKEILDEIESRIFKDFLNVKFRELLKPSID